MDSEIWGVKFHPCMMCVHVICHPFIVRDRTTLVCVEVPPYITKHIKREISQRKIRKCKIIKLESWREPNNMTGNRTHQSYVGTYCRSVLCITSPLQRSCQGSRYHHIAYTENQDVLTVYRIPRECWKTSRISLEPVSHSLHDMRELVIYSQITPSPEEIDFAIL